jgi:hypothetical protein
MNSLLTNCRNGCVQNYILHYVIVTVLFKTTDFQNTYGSLLSNFLADVAVYLRRFSLFELMYL